MDDSEKKTQDAQALLAMIAQGDEDIAAGRVIPAEEVFAKIRAKLQAKRSD